MSGRRLRIVHSTGYQYAEPVTASFNEVRMTPRDGGGQALLSHQLRVSPRASVQMYVDYWGATVQAFDVHEVHGALEIVATSLVDVPAMGGLPGGVAWAELGSEALVDRWGEFLAPTRLVESIGADDGRWTVLEGLRSLGTPRDAILGVVSAVRDQVAYDDDATTVRTTATQAWATRGGVCQDFTHTSLALLRALGVPARYVSGYLHTEEEAPGQTVVGESHAWVEAWDGGWFGLDPTNDRSVGAAHVVVARGRDYDDVPPLKGIYAGGASEALGVTVEITQLAV